VKISFKPVMAFLMMCIMTTFVSAQETEVDLENLLYMELETGRVVIKMHPEVAPKHVARIKELTRQKFYDGIIFHRVIAGFMAQTGDPEGTGGGGSGQLLEAEFSAVPHYKGMVSMAREGASSSAPEEITRANNSGDSQFFICLAYSPHLDGQYTVWGEVISGMRYVDQIKKGVVPELTDPDKIVTMRVAADVEN
jgi:peptidylprolyl isomerase